MCVHIKNGFVRLPHREQSPVLVSKMVECIWLLVPLQLRELLRQDNVETDFNLVFLKLKGQVLLLFIGVQHAVLSQVLVELFQELDLLRGAHLVVLKKIYRNEVSVLVAGKLELPLQIHVGYHDQVKYHIDRNGNVERGHEQ